jgi:hypothetical protein
MKKTIFKNCLKIVFLLITLTSAETKNNNIVGGYFGFVTPFAQNSVFVEFSESTFWFEHELGIIFGTHYYRVLNPFIRAGAFFEMEKYKLDHVFYKGYSGKRFSFGANWLSRFPDWLVSLQIGISFGMSFVTEDEEEDWDSRGIDYEAFGGPSVEYEHFGFAIHFIGHYGWYLGDKPKEVTCPDPRIRFIVYFLF